MGELTSPLLNVIRRAAETKVEGPVAKMKKRFDDATDEIVVLCDCSISMADVIGNCNLSKFEHLEIALKDVCLYHPKLRLVAFHSYPLVIADVSHLPPLGPSTNLAKAFDFVAKWKPRKTIVISDGLPDSEDMAVLAAERLTGAIDTIYCGPDSHPAAAFLAKLARSTGGQPMIWDGYRELSGAVRGLLPAPSAG